MSEIRLFAGDFAPKSWATCDGQLIAIATNQALFSLLGTTFGGDGRQTFALPDLRGRAAVGLDKSGVTILGQVFGSQTALINGDQMPSHNHLTPTPFVPPAASQPIMKVCATNADQSTPSAGNSFGIMGTVEGRGGFTSVNAYNAEVPDITLSAASYQISGFGESGAGGNQPHNNIQPYIGVPHVICMYGVYPTRS